MKAMKKKYLSLLERQLPNFTLLLYVIAVTIGALEGGLWAALGIGGATILFAALCALGKNIPRPPNDLAALAMAFFLTVGAAESSNPSQPTLSVAGMGEVDGDLPAAAFSDEPLNCRTHRPSELFLRPAAGHGRGRPRSWLSCCM